MAVRWQQFSGPDTAVAQLQLYELGVDLITFMFMSNGIRKWPNENKETSASRTEGTLITQTHTITCTAKPINIQTFSFTQTSCVHTKSCVFFLIKSLTFSRSWFNPELSSMVIPQKRRGEENTVEHKTVSLACELICYQCIIWIKQNYISFVDQQGKN